MTISIHMKFELMPNENLMECFQYLNAPDLFYSFDQLNYRFSKLIRNIQLYLSFRQFKRSSFNNFCEIISSNVEIKSRIIYLQLSNDGTCDQIENFLSKFSFNDFINLHSLTLIDLSNYNVQQLLTMLPFSSNLKSFAFTCQEYGYTKLMDAISKSHVRILTISQLNFFSSVIHKTISLIISLHLNNSTIEDLIEVFQCTSVLKKLKIQYLYDNVIDDNRNDEWIFIDINTINLKQFIINDCQIKFKFLQFLLNKMTNLKLFSISSSRIEMIDANIWQSIIEYSLINLQIFQFCFHYNDIDSYDEKFIKSQSFQTQFWSQHKWNINYEISRYSLLIYTTPFIRKEYKLDLNMDKSVRIYNYLNLFDNVMDLTICTRSIKKKLYFRNIISLTIPRSYYDDRKLEYIYDLDRIVNKSNIKHLRIEENFCLSLSSIFLQLLKELPNVDSLTIEKYVLFKLLFNHELRDLLNTKIIKLDFSCDRYFTHKYDQHKAFTMIVRTFSNIECIVCNITKVSELLLLLERCSKLLIVKLGKISEDLYLYTQSILPTLNIYFNFTQVEY